MKVAFFCGSLEPGRDGVGDYCRKLGSELCALGHEVLLISLNDRRQRYSIHGLENGLSILRCGLPASLPQRMEWVRKGLQDFSPDWISLQYVCYGYHPKGLAWRWNPFFASLGGLCGRRHLALHELWIGPPPVWRQWIGWGQRWIIRDLCSRFHPQLVTTSTPDYQCRLAREGITAGVIPLFGNISVAKRDDAGVGALLRASGSRLALRPRAEFLNGVFFGTLHPDFNEEPLVRWLAELHERVAKPVLLTMIGRAGSAAGPLAKRLNGSAAGAVEVICLGEQPGETISQVLQFADFGINTGSAELLGKSGTFAAMREHGLPVMVPDGGLDPAFRGAIPPVRQFSSEGSAASVMKPARPENFTVPAGRAANALLELFEKAAFEPSSTAFSSNLANPIFETHDANFG